MEKLIDDIRLTLITLIKQFEQGPLQIELSLMNCRVIALATLTSGRIGPMVLRIIAHAIYDLKSILTIFNFWFNRKSMRGYPPSKPNLGTLIQNRNPLVN